MAAKPVESDPTVLSDLAVHAQKLISEFVALPHDARRRATQLLYELEHVVAEFRRLRPPLPFKRSRLRAVGPHICSICDAKIDEGLADYIQADGATYHRRCYEAVQSA